MLLARLRLVACSTFLAVGAMVSPVAAQAQLVREDSTPAAQQLTDSAKSNAPSATTGKVRLSQDFALKGDSHWTDTGVEVQAGEHILFSGTGSLKYFDADSENGPEGLPRSYRDLLRILPFNDSGRGALIGRIGDADTAQPFLIGTKREMVASVAGKLALGINQSNDDAADGAFTVHVEIYAADSKAGEAALVVARQVKSMKGIDKKLFSKLPRRIADKDGNPGDMVNFLILGSEEAMQKVFTTAGWVKVDADVKDSVLRGILGSLSKESYLTMPMSQLYLFGRPQDYGWAHAEPISVVTSRNHLRIWKAPFTVNGETLWVGAATHDIGLERDQRNNGITHKIDPDIDLERNYVEKTLTSTGLVAEVCHFLPENPLKEAKTATGGTFHSNGEVLILKLAGAAKNLSASGASKQD